MGNDALDVLRLHSRKGRSESCGQEHPFVFFLGTLLSVLALPQPAAADDVPSPAGAKAADASKGKTYFIADNGDDRNPGTIERPFATLYKAHQVVGPANINIRPALPLCYKTKPRLLSPFRPQGEHNPLLFRADWPVNNPPWAPLKTDTNLRQSRWQKNDFGGCVGPTSS